MLILLLSLAVLAVTACKRKTAANVYKGVQATRPAIDKNGNPIEGLAIDSLQFVRPEDCADCTDVRHTGYNTAQHNSTHTRAGVYHGRGLHH